MMPQATFVNEGRRQEGSQIISTASSLYFSHRRKEEDKTKEGIETTSKINKKKNKQQNRKNFSSVHLSGDRFSVKRGRRR
jgi:hypothetical protein